MPIVTYPYNNENYKSLSGLYINPAQVEVTPGGLLSAVGVVVCGNQICPQLYVTIDGGIEIIGGQTGRNAFQVGQYGGVSGQQLISSMPIQGFSLSYSSDFSLQCISQGTFTSIGNEQFDGNNGNCYLNTNTVVVPSGSNVMGLCWIPSGNQVCLGVMTAPTS